MPKRKRSPEVVSAQKELNKAQKQQEQDEQKVQAASNTVQEAKAVLEEAQRHLEKAQTRLEQSQDCVNQANLKLEAAELTEDSLWNTNYSKLKRYKETHGHINLPGRCNNDKELDKLCVWVIKQKSMHKNYKLGKIKEYKTYRIKALESLGIDWEPLATLWEKRFSDLVNFKQRHGHTMVPQHWNENKDLGTWTMIQRTEMKAWREGKKTPITQERIDRLNEIGFVWNVFEKNWREMYDKFVEFQNGTSFPDSQGKALSRWCDRQRKEHHMYMNGERESKKCRLTEEKIKLLEEVGFEWE